MESVFLKLLNMSITASWLIMAVLLFRMLLRKAPMAIRGVLWAFVGVRLVMPFNFRSVWSLIPSAETVNPDILYADKPVIHSGIPVINQAVNPVLSESMAPAIGDSVNPLQIISSIASVIWLIGMATLLLYAVISYIRLRRQVSSAMWLKDSIWLGDQVPSPFILGLFKPRIYLPSGLVQSQRALVIAHEMAHIKRLDHWWKPLGFVLMAVYWFNPLIWLAYVMLCRDIEFACDEQVIKGMGLDEKKNYSIALLTSSTPRRQITACPLAFGESGVKQRIRQVLDFRRPAFWLILVALISCIAVAACFLTDPADNEDPSLLNYKNLVSLAKQSQTWPVIQSGDSGVLDGAISGEALASYLDDGSWTPQRWGRPVQRKAAKSTESIEVQMNATVWLRLFNTDTARIYTDGKERYYQMLEGDYLKALRLVNAPASSEIVPYVSVKCLYMNPLSSQWGIDDSGLRYFIGADTFTILKKDSGEVLVPSTSVTEGWQNLQPEEWNGFFKLMAPGKDLLQAVQQPRWRKLSDRYYLYDMDGTLWIGQFNSDKVGLWNLYELTPEVPGSVDWDTQPTISPTGGSNGPKSRQIGQADLDRDGSAESISVLTVDDAMLYQLTVSKADGATLWQTEMATAHVGWDSLFLCTIDEQPFLLRYNPTMFQGECSYHYELFTLEGGKLTIRKSSEVVFDVNGRNLLDVDALTTFADEVNRLLENSILLLSTEGGEVAIGPSGTENFREDYSDLLTNGFSNLTEAAVVRAAQVHARDVLHELESITNFHTPLIEMVDTSRFSGLPIRVKEYDQGGPFYAVTFNTIKDAMLGPIILFVDKHGTVFAIQSRY